MNYVSLGRNLYRRGCTFYYRDQTGGSRTWIKLNATSISEARRELASHTSRPTHSGEPTIHDVLNFYLLHNCPKRNEQPRDGRQLSMEIKRVATLSQFFSQSPASSINHSMLRIYREWRGQTRACELDISTLASAFRWAYRNPDKTGLHHNPMPQDRPRFAPPKHHCRDRQPSDAEQLHAIAQAMMQDERSGCMGWFVLFLAFTGLRRDCARFFRMDATNHNPGHNDGECIWVGVSETHKGVFPFVRLHDALSLWWNAFVAWRKQEDVASPWYFPSPRNTAVPVSRDGLGQAMRRTCQQLGIPPCSPHGLRSYFVNVLRSQGVMDAEIALRIGHRSGGRLIVDVYGEVLPKPITFLPHRQPEWVNVENGTDLGTDFPVESGLKGSVT